VDDPAPAPYAPVVVASASAAPAVVVPNDEGPYARGLALEARGDLEGAARELKRAADEDPGHGDIALYALGRLSQRRLHDAGRASAAYHLYRSRYPHGALLPEVDLGILELEVDGHSDAAALADSTRFLATHPTSERVDQVHLLRGNLLRDGGDCRGALTDYALVHTAPLTDHAAYSTAYCQRKLGDRVVAAATLRDYLTRFPAGAHRVEAERALAEGH
jgi:outer membrane protein assembly factor BamD (BamD/ComL family)